MKKILQILTVLVLELLLIGTTPAAAQDEINISVNLSDYAISGSDFVVMVDVPEVTDLKGFKFDISFDSKVLELFNIGMGTIRTTEISASGSENEDGTYTIRKDVDANDNPGVSGPGYLAVLHFNVIDLAASSSDLVIFNGFLYDSGDGEIPAPWLGNSVTVSYPLEIITDSLSEGIVGDVYSATLLKGSGGNGSYSWLIPAGSLPDGISLSEAGEISGTPTTSGTFSFTIKATSGKLTDSKSYDLRVNDSLEITTDSIPDGVVGITCSTTLEGTGGNDSYSWSILSGSLPDGISLSPAGEISGTPTTAGTFSFTIKATDGALTDSELYSIDVQEISIPAVRETGTGKSSLLWIGIFTPLLALVGAGGCLLFVGRRQALQALQAASIVSSKKTPKSSK